MVENVVVLSNFKPYGFPLFMAIVNYIVIN
jgi:hypothetical protein